MTEPRYRDARVRVFHGDCRDVLATMDECSVDAVVCDPPYDLTSGDGSRGFMGHEWDGAGVAFEPATWKAVFRVLKPNGMLAAFGGTRTVHRMVCAIEDAGFVIVNPPIAMVWSYGSGFPKGLDISKGIDRRRDDHVRHVCSFLRDAIDGHRSHTNRTVADSLGLNERSVEHWAARESDSQPRVPTEEQWAEMKAVLGFGDDMDAEVARLNGRKSQPGDDWYQREVVAQRSNGIAGGTGEHAAIADMYGYRGVYDVTMAASDEARRFDGYNVALKPAYEPIVLATKPGGDPVGVGGVSPVRYMAKAASKERPVYMRPNPDRTVLRLRDDLTADQIAQVTAALIEAGINVE